MHYNSEVQVRRGSSPTCGEVLPPDRALPGPVHGGGRCGAEAVFLYFVPLPGPDGEPLLEMRFAPAGRSFPLIRPAFPFGVAERVGARADRLCK